MPYFAHIPRDPTMSVANSIIITSTPITTSRTIWPSSEVTSTSNVTAIRLFPLGPIVNGTTPTSIERENISTRTGIDKGLDAGKIVGITLGSIFLVLILAAVIGYLILLRRRKNQRRVQEVNNRQYFASTSEKPTVTVEPYPIAGNDEATWQLHLDDDTMVRNFKSLDAKILGHVINFHVPEVMTPVEVGESSSVAGNDTSIEANMSKEELEFFKSIIDKFPQLVDKSRVFVVRALLSGIMFGAVERGEFYTDKRPGGLLSRKVGQKGISENDDYHQSREDAIHRISETAYTYLRPLVAAPSELSLHTDPRLLDLQSLVRTVAEFATTMEQQPGRFSIAWNANSPTTTQTKSQLGMPVQSGTAPQYTYNEEEMEVVMSVERNSTRSGLPGTKEMRVCGVVFPGLKKVVEGREVLLVKIQVLVY